MKLHSHKLETEKYLAFNWDWFFISSTIITSIHRNERSKKRIHPKTFIEENNSEIEIKRLRSKLRQIYLKFFFERCDYHHQKQIQTLGFFQLFCLFYSTASNCLLSLSLQNNNVYRSVFILIFLCKSSFFLCLLEM